MNRWLAFAPLGILVALGLLFGLYALNRNPQVQPQALVGKPVPALQLPTLEGGQPATLREMASEGPLLVNFFASWCAPCEIEHPVLMGLKGQPVRVVGVAYKDAPQNTQAFLARLGDPYAEILVDRDGRAGVEFGVTGVPETYVVGQDGMILAKHTGPLTAAEAQRLAGLAR
ncbi:DsbE family thiol:disulfide interchange protein [Phenylobacterium sp. VNQ135]|uniref:DsbE family thiol:disulfide interchange protein n=1 Tax=Phenylobacterium sp. VNQ135 TaxID=3400922 RepID=UPI003BFF4C3A